MRRSTLKITFFLVLVALIATGCGGGDDQSSSQTQGAGGNAAASLTPEQAKFVDSGDAICKKTDKTQERGIRDYLTKNPEAQNTKAGQEKMVMAVGLPPIQVEAEELAALEVPPGDEAKIAAIIEGIEAA